MTKETNCLTDKKWVKINDDKEKDNINRFRWSFE